MAYKNSDGNKGAGEAFYNWRYFNSSLKKLDGYKPANINTKGAVDTKDPMKAWGSLIKNGVALAGAVDGYFAQMREKDKEKMRDFLKQNPINKWGDIETQKSFGVYNNPFAKEMIAEQKGQIIAGLANRDWTEAVNRGEFKDLTPEEADQKRFELFQKAKEEYISCNNIQDEQAFDRGLFSIGLESRQKLLEHWTTVNNDIETNSIITDMQTNFLNGISTGKDPLVAIQEVNEKFGILAGTVPPDKLQSFYSNLVKMTAEQPNAEGYIEALGESTIWGTDSKLKDYMGESGWKTIQLQSLNSTIKSNDANFTAWCEAIDGATELIGGAQQLRDLRNQMWKTNGDKNDKKILYLNNAIKKAERFEEAEQKRLLAESAKIQAEADNKEYSRLVLDVMSDKGNLNTSDIQDLKPKGWTSKDLRTYLHDGIASGKVKASDLVNLATNPYPIPSEFQVVQDLFKEYGAKYRSNIMNDITALSRDPNYQIPDRDDYKILGEVATLDPSALAQVMQTTDKSTVAQVLLLADMQKAQGDLGYRDLVKATAQRVQLLKEDGNGVAFKKFTEGVDKALKDGVRSEFGDSRDFMPWEREMYYTIALASAFSGKDPKEAVAYAQNKMGELFIQTNRGLMPRNFIYNPDLRGSPKASEVVDRVAYELSPEVSKNKREVSCYYSSAEDSMIYLDKNYKPIFKMSRAQLNEGIEKYLDKTSKEITEKQVNKVKRQQGGEPEVQQNTDTTLNTGD